MNRNSTYYPPFVKVLPAALPGIITGLALPLPVWITAPAAVMLAAASSLGINKRYVDILLLAAVFLTFHLLTVFARPQSVLPQGQRLTMRAVVIEEPVVRGRWQNTTAYVDSYLGTDGQWIQARERIVLRVDTSVTVGAGSRVAFNGWVNAVDTTGSSYGRLMSNRGYYSHVYLIPWNVISVGYDSWGTLTAYSVALQSRVRAKMQRLEMPSEELSVATAMVSGDKRYVPPGIRRAYASSGAAHLLAVSGLHVGIVFMVINLFLYILPAFRRGHVARNIIAVMLIWLYAFAAGLSPSVIRAALMFSFGQFALASSSYRSALNIVLASAVLMLAVNPNYLLDPSFQLSYAAVISIMLLFPAWYRPLHTRSRIVNAVTSIMIVGLAASVGTAPLVSYWFGSIPVAGILINPVVILTANIIVAAGILWLLCPMAVCAPLFSWLIGLAARVQNNVVEWCATLPWAKIDVSLPIWAVAVVYLLLGITAGLLQRNDRDDTPLAEK